MAGPCKIDLSPRPRTNENAWSLVDELKTTYWGHRSINISRDYQDILELDQKVHTVLMTILCDHGTHLGIMATNITDNFAREVKPQQLHHFLNLHVCNLDNNDLFYQHYYKNVLMQQPADFLNLNMGISSTLQNQLEKSPNGSRNGPKPSITHSHEFDYAIAITLDENSFLDCSMLFKHIKKNADKTLNILGQPPYFHFPTV
jgi:hypothetical protein